MTLTAPVRPVLVLDDGGTVAGIAAQRWAAAEASRRELPLQLVGTQADGVRAVHRLRGEYPRLPVELYRLPGPVGRALRPLTADAALLALPAPAAEPVLSSSFCPTAVVPADDTARGRVVVGVAPWTPEEVLRTAVDEALERDAELVAVRAWRAGGQGLRDLARLLPNPFGAERIGGVGDTAEEAQRELDQLLSPWRIGYPDLRLHPLVVHGDAAAVLTMLSVDAELLVVGRSGRGALLRAVAGAPGDDAVAAARCPVLVVPEPAPPRREMLALPGSRGPTG
ncbi:universal stress protein [Pseudonocardia kujensis]|uniref:universal stress protein n=1 Tax=Pseudonocardia kujensis TaxID=1128675 RepID=UPI001E624614|nr:universal stress protein [Pseudonocardia kujensis]MCE0764439.1 universal stress protein [Pseudonocardia kujensis]